MTCNQRLILVVQILVLVVLGRLAFLLAFLRGLGIFAILNILALGRLVVGSRRFLRLGIFIDEVAANRVQIVVSFDEIVLGHIFEFRQLVLVLEFLLEVVIELIVEIVLVEIVQVVIGGHDLESLGAFVRLGLWHPIWRRPVRGRPER